MSLEESFKGKCVIVTGAGNGIGRALSQRLHSYGAKVYALSRSQEPLDTLVKECPSIFAIQLDIGLDWENTRRVVDSIKDVDVVINNAAIVDLLKPALDVSEQEFDRVFDVNAKALFNISQAAARNMIEGKRSGSIINISSIAAMRAMEGISVYSGSKAAVDMFTKSMAFELGKHQIRVNAINPGLILTTIPDKIGAKGQGEEIGEWMTHVLNKVPYNKDYLPMEEVVNTILFIASDLSKSLTGSCIVHDGGFSIT